jgi:hypothetical protein
MTNLHDSWYEFAKEIVVHEPSLTDKYVTGYYDALNHFADAMVSFVEKHPMESISREEILSIIRNLTPHD